MPPLQPIPRECGEFMIKLKGSKSMHLLWISIGCAAMASAILIFVVWTLADGPPCVDYNNWPNEKFDSSAWTKGIDRYKMVKDLVNSRQFSSENDLEAVLGRPDGGFSQFCYSINVPPPKPSNWSACLGYQLCFKKKEYIVPTLIPNS